MTAKQIAERLRGRRSGSGWQAKCTAHKDEKPSVSITESDGRVLVFCHAGCTTESVLAAAGLEMRDLFVDASTGPQIEKTYSYVDENGNLLFEVVRYQPKGFKQRRPDTNGGWIWNLNGTRRVLYNLPNVLQAKAVLVVEGEKDCEAASDMKLVATCNSGGAGKWRNEYGEFLWEKSVAIIADADKPGRKHARQIAASLSSKVKSLKVIELGGAKDLEEWVKHGGTRGELLELIRNAPEWPPEPTLEQVVLPEEKLGAITRNFSDISPQPVRWLWPGRIPLGKLTLLIGDPGLGKSLLTTEIASCVSRGAKFPDGSTCEAGSVILLSAEDDIADTVRPRLDAAIADVTHVYALEAVRVLLNDGTAAERVFSLEADIATLADLLARIPNPRLIVIDPLSAYLGRRDAHKNAEIRGLLTPVSALAARYGVAILGVTHLRKSSGTAVHRAIDSIAFIAAARAAWCVASDPCDPQRRLLAPVKQNLAADSGGLAFRIEAPKGIARLSWEPGTIKMDINEVLGTFENGDSRNSGREARAWLSDLLADGPVSVKEIQSMANAAGLTWITVRRAKDALGILTKKDAFSGGWSWRLVPDEDAQGEGAHSMHTK